MNYQSPVENTILLKILVMQKNTQTAILQPSNIIFKKSLFFKKTKDFSYSFSTKGK